MQDDDVEGVVGERQVVDVALPHAAMFQARALQPVARQQQHVERQIEAEPALDLRAEQFEHAAGAGAEIKQRAERLVGERGADRVLHRLVGDVQLADAVPFGGVRAEISLRGGGARLRAPRRAASRSRRDGLVGRIEPLEQRARDLGAAAVLGQPEEGPGALAEALDQAGLGQAA